MTLAGGNFFNVKAGHTMKTVGVQFLCGCDQSQLKYARAKNSHRTAAIRPLCDILTETLNVFQIMYSAGVGYVVKYMNA